MGKKLSRIVDLFRGLRVVVVGDVMLDEYMWGQIERISPEAPVQVLLAKSQNYALGGAANVANNLASMGCNVELVGVVGEDEWGAKLEKLLAERGIRCAGLVRAAARSTTVKTRLIAESQQILRIDKEETTPIGGEVEKKVVGFALDAIPRSDGLICSDYRKGVLTEKVIKACIDCARRSGKVVVLDPKGHDYSIYRGVHVLTPNRKEIELATGLSADGQDGLKRCAEKVFNLTGADAILLKKGKDGMALFSNGGEVIEISTEAREVYDVTGAGDTAISFFGMAVFAGCSYEEAARLANIAAGIVVSKLGTAVVTPAELTGYLEEKLLHEETKVVSLNELKQIVNYARNRGKTIVFTNGCFDILHVGHIKYLQRAKAFGDLLVVGLNDDASVRKLKGPQRPLIGQAERAKIMAALNCVNYVVVFSETTPEKLIRELRPDYLVKGGDYRAEEVVGKEIVESYGGRVELVPVIEGISTTEIVRRIVEKYN